MTQALEAPLSISAFTFDQTGGHFSHLACKECGTEYEPKATHVCQECFGPLEVKYDYESLMRTVTR